MAETTVVVSADAIERLAGYAQERRWRAALLVMDLNTLDAAGARVAEALHDAGVQTERLLFEQRSGLKADDDAVAAVRRRLTGKARPVALGSGVITDIVRYAAHLEEVDFVSVPTAASMDGYASNMAAMERAGVKVTYPARVPEAIFADPRVAASAPLELTRAGIGDLLGKATARIDWLAAHTMCGEPFVEAAAARVLGPLSFVVAEVDSILAQEPRALRELLLGLIESGMAMATAGSSRPASGCEHHASHFWDLLASRGRRPHCSHGLQVGYATRFAMRLQRFAFGGGVAELRLPRTVGDPFAGAARAWLGEPTADLLDAVRAKQRFIDDAAAHWPATLEQWQAVTERLAPELERFDGVERALTRAAIPDSPGFLDLDEQTLRATFRYATRLRARYTTIDFLEGQEVLDEAIDAMLR